MEPDASESVDQHTAELIMRTILTDIDGELKNMTAQTDGISDSQVNDRHTALLLWKQQLDEGGLAHGDIHMALGLPTVPASVQHECAACLGQFYEVELITASCSHRYCDGCIVRLLETSLTDENLFPPRCCRQVLPLEEARCFINDATWERYIEKEIEHNDHARTYCSNPACSRYILPSDIRGSLGKCRSCSRRTCVRCKLVAHPGQCPDPDEEVLALAREEGWRRCPNCRHMVELRSGCNHITCRCGHQYCYVCAAKWRRCHCARWDEARLVERAAAVTARRQGIIANAGEVQEGAFEVDFDDCDHEGEWVSIPGEAECEYCEELLPYYILECEDCGYQLCERCLSTWDDDWYDDWYYF